jgi:bla regulator protein BlaR1
MKTSQLKSWPVVAIVLLFVSVLALWPTFRTAAQKKDKPATSYKRLENDSTRRKSHANGSRSKISNIDQQSIDKAMEEVENSLRNFEEKEWPNVQLEIENALKEVDAAKINSEIAAAMKEVDLDKIKIEIKQALKDVDVAKICAEVKASLKEIDADKICTEVKASLKKVDWDGIHQEIREAQKINAQQIAKQMEEVKNQMAHLKVDMKEQMKNASKQMAKAMEHLQLMKDGLQALEADGLIKKGDKVNIEYKDGIMYLNDVPQTKEVSDKYKKYFEGQHWNINKYENDGDRNSDKVK